MEHALLSELNVDGIPRAHELARHEGNLWLVLEDTGAVPLSTLLAGKPLDPAAAIHLALQLASILSELHQRGVIHGAVRPGNVLVHPDRHELSLIGFARAGRPVSLRLDELAYVSPEQTGRMSRIVDHRTDLYSAGLTLYEMLTGVPAFRAADALELIHAHIARVPPPPVELRPRVPEALSRIAMKAHREGGRRPLSERAGAQGRSRDLRARMERASGDPSVPPRNPGCDGPFLIPQRLYGRDREVGRLREAFDRACAGPSGLVLVSGYSGIGKTSLIPGAVPADRPGARGVHHREVRPAHAQRPVRRLGPAFRGLVQQLLTESEERLLARRRRLDAALGENAGVLIDVIPRSSCSSGSGRRRRLWPRSRRRTGSAWCSRTSWARSPSASIRSRSSSTTCSGPTTPASRSSIPCSRAPMSVTSS
jgi:serine/threonine protein kinase